MPPGWNCRDVQFFISRISFDQLGPERERALHRYPSELKARFGGYYRLGGWFVKLIGNPHVMRVATKHGLPHPTLMRFVLKLLANLTDPRDGDAMDKIINTLTRLAPLSTVRLSRAVRSRLGHTAARTLDEAA